MGSVFVVEALIQAGADKDAKDGEGRTPLHFAARDGHASAVEALVKAGANKESKDGDGLTPLHLAARDGHASAVEVLVQAGADKEAKVGEIGLTPLHFAAFKGHASAVEVLVKAGANKEAMDLSGQTPQDMAKAEDNTAVVEILSKKYRSSRIKEGAASKTSKTNFLKRLFGGRT